MNLNAFLSRGTAYAPSDARRYHERTAAEAEQARAQWLNALLVDQTRAWMNLGEYDAGVLSGLACILALAVHAHHHDGGSPDAPGVRVIRGGISAAAQCAKADCVMTAAYAQALSAAAQRADAIIRGASADAIAHASVIFAKQVKL